MDSTNIDQNILIRIRRIALSALKRKKVSYLSLDELISAGCLGYVHSLKKFRPELGVKFTHYSNQMIFWAMLNEVRDALEREKPQLRDSEKKIGLLSDDWHAFRDLCDAIDLDNMVKDLRLRERDRLILELRCQGFYGHEISEKIGLCPAQVHVIINKIGRRIRRRISLQSKFEK